MISIVPNCTIPMHTVKMVLEEKSCNKQWCVTSSMYHHCVSLPHSTSHLQMVPFYLAGLSNLLFSVSARGVYCIGCLYINDLLLHWIINIPLWPSIVIVSCSLPVSRTLPKKIRIRPTDGDQSICNASGTLLGIILSGLSPPMNILLIRYIDWLANTMLTLH